jgi:hypothetical protein
MSTQIFTSPQDNCKVDHIKVATLASSFNTSIAPDNDDTWAFIGGTYSWMSNPTNYYTAALGGNILNVPSTLPAMAIILPVDVDVNDIITLQGTAYGVAAGGANCQFLIGVSYVSCEDFTGAVDEKVNVFTLIPAELFPAIPKPKFNVCFSLETSDVTLPAGTLLYVGVNCPTFYNPPADCNFSYTLDITKSCAPIPVITNVRIQNCCEQAVFEVISLGTQNLPASGTFSDTEGNCWTIIETTSDPVDTVRFVDTPYQDCAACLIANPCPSNLTVVSCCTGQGESFTGSLPGINVGDTFIDTYGFCWNVTAETSGPITGLVIVDSITTDCPTCITTPGACPDIYEIRSCCQLSASLASLDSNDGPMVAGPVESGTSLYTTLDLLGSGVVPGNTFMDQYGYCWSISPFSPIGVTVNAAFIQAVTNYGTYYGCQTCLTDLDNCKDFVIYKVQNCCSGVIEYVEAPFGFSVDNAISISTTVTPNVSECYKIIEWDNTTTPTITIDSFNGLAPSCDMCGGCPNFYIAKSCDGLTVDKVFYGTCEINPSRPGEPEEVYSFLGDDNICYYSECIVTSGPATVVVEQPTRGCGDCPNFYIAYDCLTDFPAVFFGTINPPPNVNPFITNDGTCYYSNGEITSGPATITVSQLTKNCGICLLQGFYTAVACDGVSPNEVIFVADNQVGLVVAADNGNCYTITTPTLGPATIRNQYGVYPDCGTCQSL